MGCKLKIAIAVVLASLAFASTTASAEKGDWIVRGGVTYIDPDSFSTPWSDTESVTAEISAETTFGFSVTWMFAERLGLDFFGVIPVEHDWEIPALRELAPELGTTKVGSAKVFPPTLSVQYHFAPEARFRPYVGAGVNYTTFSSEKIIEGELDIDSSTGFAANVGIDFAFGENWLLNLDIRYLDIELKTTQTIRGDEPGEPDEVYADPARSIDPMVYSLMVGYRF
jgi:outer membrane protein